MSASASSKEAEQLGASASSGEVSLAKLTGECHYCGKAVYNKERLLPLECSECKNLFHVRCLKGSKPQVFLGDNLYRFTCAFCGRLGKEAWERPNLQWVHVTHLALYNLILNGRGGRRGYFRWNEDICGFIRTNWSALMPNRKKTQSWHSTVAGTLSVHCPSVFQSGTGMFGEHGWWSLTAMVPPSLKLALGGSLLGKRTSAGGSQGSSSQPDWAPPTKKSKPSGDHAKPRSGGGTVRAPSSQKPFPPPPPPMEKSPPFTFTPPPTETAESANQHMLALTEQQERVVESYLSQCLLAVQAQPKASRLLRKLKVRSKQRLYNHEVFDLDTTICRLLSSTVKYVVDKGAAYSEQVSPVLRAASEVVHQQTNAQAEVSSRLAKRVSPHVDILDHLSLIPVLSRALPPEFKTFRQMLCGAGDVLARIVSPYTTRKLPPFIFRTSELLPPKVKLNREIVGYRQRKSDVPASPDNPASPDIPAPPDNPASPDIPTAHHGIDIADRQWRSDIPASPDIPAAPQGSGDIVDRQRGSDIPDNPASPDFPSVPQGVDFCYLQEHHVPAVNNLLSHFFWPVDISECLHYPDFTCVVLHGKLVVGCGFMTPDVKVNEAYISFLLVHPDFQRSSIGKIMLYHLIQSCMGKDVTIHVSVDNPAMMLYQTMGFKAERYCLDFYRYYYPEGHHLSKNAYFMRLRK